LIEVWKRDQVLSGTHQGTAIGLGPESGVDADASEGLPLSRFGLFLKSQVPNRGLPARARCGDDAWTIRASDGSKRCVAYRL
jgi:hypothetical protein